MKIPSHLNILALLPGSNYCPFTFIGTLTHYQTTNFRLFQTERVCRQNFKFDENGRKLSKRVENTVRKGKIARNECFQKACFPGASKGVIVWEWEPITRRQILDWSKLKQSADDNFEFDENTRKLSKQVENTVGTGEIACCEQFLLYPQCFQTACFPGASKGVTVWEGYNMGGMRISCCHL